MSSGASSSSSPATGGRKIGRGLRRILSILRLSFDPPPEADPEPDEAASLPKTGREETPVVLTKLQKWVRVAELARVGGAVQGGGKGFVWLLVMHD